MQEFLKDDLSLFALPFYVVAITLEVWWSRKRGLVLYRGADTRTSLAMGVLSILVEVLPRLLALFVMVKPYDISPLRDGVGHQWWAGHVNHHSSHHRVLHGSNVRYLDCNHGGVLIIWDKLFGTFSPERDDDPVVYGLTTNIDSDNIVWVAVHEYVSIACATCYSHRVGAMMARTSALNVAAHVGLVRLSALPEGALKPAHCRASCNSRPCPAACHQSAGE